MVPALSLTRESVLAYRYKEFPAPTFLPRSLKNSSYRKSYCPAFRPLKPSLEAQPGTGLR
jgi:hypothetical protein